MYCVVNEAMFTYYNKWIDKVESSFGLLQTPDQNCPHTPPLTLHFALSEQ